MGSSTIQIFKSLQLLMSESQYFKVYYSKDMNKKKKSFLEGIFFKGSHKVKLYDENCKVIYQGAISNMYYHNVQSDQEFKLANTYFVSVEKQISKQSFLNGTAFMEKPFTVANTKKVRCKSPNKQIQIEQGSIPLNSDYRIDQFIAKKLRPHQVQGVKFMFDSIIDSNNKNRNGCILADYMGLGKTLQTLTLLYCCLKNIGKNNIFKKAIVVSPLSLVKVWEKQQQKWFKDRILPLVASGDSENINKKIDSFVKDKYRLLFLSYQSFIKHIKTLNGRCDIIVFDEGHRLKNDKSKSYKAIKSFSCKRRILLTGTPLQNNIQEFYACICLVNPNQFSSDQLFKNVYKKPIQLAMKSTATQQQIQMGMQRSRCLTNIVKQFSLRRKGDVLQDILPPKKQYHVFIPLNDIQIKWTQRFLKNAYNNDIMYIMSMLRKNLVSSKLFKEALITKGGNFQDYYEDISGQISGKIQFIIDVASNCLSLHQKLIIVSSYTETLNFIQKTLVENAIKCFRLDGSMNDNNRQVQIDKFRQSAYGSVFLLSSKAGGTGLNLTMANKMIMMQPDWNPSNDHQVMGRLWRDGQLKPVHIYRLIALGTFQQRILQRQYLKQSLSDKLIDQSSKTMLFDMNQMRNLLIMSESKCLTYAKQLNQIQEVKTWNYDFKKSQEGVFVYIKKDKEDHSRINQFDQEDMFLHAQEQNEEQQSEKQSETEEFQQFQEQNLSSSKIANKKQQSQKNKQDQSNFNQNLDPNLNEIDLQNSSSKAQIQKQSQNQPKVIYKNNILNKLRKPTTQNLELEN